MVILQEMLDDLWSFFSRTEGDWTQMNALDLKPSISKEERRARRELRREKQRKDNLDRAAKMHELRLQMRVGNPEPVSKGLSRSIFVGCSGWFYWKWRGTFYPDDLPTSNWFAHYSDRLDTVEINA